MSAAYDIAGILRALPALSEMFLRDGHRPRRAGSVLFVCCPIHEEKTPSCQINDDTGKFHCFGCGARGDVFDYWQQTRGLAFRDALEQLAGLVGIGPATVSTPAKAKPAPGPRQDAAVPLTGTLLDQWIRAAESLAASDRQISRIAKWRGIDPACVRFAAVKGLMGLFPYYGKEREAFLVERPQGGALLPVSVHVRLAPHTQGNPHDKPTWRFTPSGVGAWPFLLGDLANAKHIFLMEGQWDALALTSVMGWHLKEKWPDLAVAGLRGSTGHKRLLDHEINPKAHVIAIADADGAGAKWFEEDGLLDRLHGRVRRVSGFWPTREKADFNELVKAGEVDRDTMLAYFLPMMPEPKPGPTFIQWCKSNQTRPDPIGRAARHVVQDKPKPAGRRPLRSWEAHWRRKAVPHDLFIDLGLAWQTYRKECRPR